MDFREDSYQDKLNRRYGLYPVSSWRWRDVMISLCAGVAFVAMVLFLANCASDLPPCERYGYGVIQDAEGEKYMVLDMEDLRKLNAMLNGVEARQCRIPREGEV